MAPLTALGAETDKLLRRLISHAPTPVFLKDSEGVYRYVNSSFEHFVGVSRDEVVGRTDHELFSHVVATRCRQSDLLALRADVPARVEEPFEVDGAERILRVLKIPIFDNHNEALGLFGIAMDVTETLRAEQGRHQERDRLVAELHDDAVQVMAAIGLALGSLEKRSDGMDRAALAELKGMVSDAIQRLRTLMSDLQVDDASNVDIRSAIEETLSLIQREHEIAFSVESRIRTPPPPPSAVALLAIAREAFINVVKHARASRIRVSLDETRGGFQLCVDDDGVGFEESVARSVEHLGLASIRARCESLGGELRIESRPGRGTRVQIWVPRPPEQLLLDE
jgi:PAS domain S-box-containing protein